MAQIYGTTPTSVRVTKQCKNHINNNVEANDCAGGGTTLYPSFPLYSNSQRQLQS